ncbi:hypothetical protein QL285_018857 [Trifolium repens]|nr:hypothetical protein QL285_018857 [Trifolium repens]
MTILRIGNTNIHRIEGRSSCYPFSCLFYNLTVVIFNNLQINLRSSGIQLFPYGLKVMLATINYFTHIVWEWICKCL